MSGAERGQVLGVSLLERSEKSGAEVARDGGELLRLRQQEHEAIRALQLAPLSIVGARAAALVRARAGQRVAAAARVLSPVGQVAPAAAVAQPSGIQAVPNQG